MSTRSQVRLHQRLERVWPDERARGPRLPDRQRNDEGQHQAGDRGRQEGDAPAVRADVGDDAAKRQAKQRPDRHPQRIDREAGSALVWAADVGDQRMGRGIAAGLAEADPKPREGQRCKAAGRAAKGGESAPQRQRDRHDGGPAPAVGEPGDRDAEHGVEDHEHRAGQDADRGVRDVQVFLDRLDQDRQHLPVEEAQRIGDHEHREHVAPPAGLRQRAGGRVDGQRGVGHARRFPWNSRAATDALFVGFALD